MMFEAEADPLLVLAEPNVESNPGKLGILGQRVYVKKMKKLLNLSWVGVNKKISDHARFILYGVGKLGGFFGRHKI